jgi:alkylation response protein AidB-like acyl-CoA dehydrogenase
MDLSLDERQRLLKSTAADFVKEVAPPHRIAELHEEADRGRPAWWPRLAELGWLGMTIPTAYGGAEATATDAAVVFEELGRGPLPGPHFSSGVLAAGLIREGGSAAQKETLLPRLCGGETIATLAAIDTPPRWGAEAVQLRAEPRDGGFLLRGRKLFVHDGVAADLFICAARAGDSGGADEAITLLLVERAAPGMAVRPHTGFLSAVAEVTFDEVAVPREAVLGEVGRGWAIVERALLPALPVLSAYQVGGCQEVFDFTAEYTRTRVVYGQPIGRFQRVQDHVVELSLHLDAARWTAYEALWKLDSGRDAAAGVHEAKAVASEGYYQACNYANMVFAGPGTALEHPLVAHTRMSRTLYQYLGDPRHHKRRMMDARFPR